MSDESSSAGSSNESGDESSDGFEVEFATTAGGLQPYMYEPEADSSDMRCATTATVDASAGRTILDVSEWYIILAVSVYESTYRVHTVIFLNIEYLGSTTGCMF